MPAEALQAEAALVTHLDHLADRVLATIAQIADVGAEIGRSGRSPWMPPEELVSALRRLDGQRGRIW